MTSVKMAWIVSRSELADGRRPSRVRGGLITLTTERFVLRAALPRWFSRCTVFRGSLGYVGLCAIVVAMSPDHGLYCTFRTYMTVALTVRALTECCERHTIEANDAKRSTLAP